MFGEGRLQFEKYRIKYYGVQIMRSFRNCCICCLYKVFCFIASDNKVSRCHTWQRVHYVKRILSPCPSSDSLTLFTNTCKSYFCRVLANLNSKRFIGRVDKHIVVIVTLS